MIKESLEKLKEEDIYSLLLFSLFQLKQSPEYSSLCELAYVIDKDNLLNLCEYFGGQTITIPTLYELESLIYSILLIKYTKIDEIPYEEAIKSIPKDNIFLKDIKPMYLELLEILKNYDFKPREKY